MQNLEVSGAVRLIYRSLGVKGLIYRVDVTGRIASPDLDGHKIRIKYKEFIRCAPTRASQTLRRNRMCELRKCICAELKSERSLTCNLVRPDTQGLPFRVDVRHERK